MSAPDGDMVNQIGEQLQLDAEGHIIGLAPPPPSLVPESDAATADTTQVPRKV